MKIRFEVGKKFCWCLWEAEWIVTHAQTQERGPPSVPSKIKNINNNIDNGNSVEREGHSLWLSWLMTLSHCPQY